MSDLPTGTVTLLFTDIEGSTRLLRSLGDGYQRALSDHRILLRRAFNLTGGHVVDRQGDAFFVVFRRAKDALAAAVEAQRAIASHPWPDGLTFRVRMGIHTGEPAVNEEGLSGLAVHRAARICAAAKGAQVLVSSTTRDLVEDELPASTELRDLGEFTLRDFERPARLYQLVAEGLRESFPLEAGTTGSPDEIVARHDPPQPTGIDPAVRTGRPVTSSRSVSGALGAVLPRPIRRRLGNDPIVLGSRIHSLSRLSPSPELAAALRALGGALIQVVRCDRDTRRTLRAADRRALGRRLDSLRADHFLTNEQARLADELAIQVEALDRLAALRPLMRAEIARVAAQVGELQEEVFSVRRGRPPTEGLVEAMIAESAAIQSLCAQVQQAEHDARPPSWGVVGNS
jgi:class 3 adenylate cyclase